MFERFAPDGRRAVAGALDVARRLGAERVEPEHLLLALAGGDRGPAARALAEAGLDRGVIENAIERDLVAALEVVGVSADVVRSIPIHPRATDPKFGPGLKQALEQALRQAVRRGERRIGSEHLLLGLLEPPAVSVYRVLGRLDVPVQRLAALLQVELAAGR